MDFAQLLTHFADTVCGYPLFLLLIGGGLFLLVSSGFISIRRLPQALAELRRSRHSSDDSGSKGISSLQALVSVVAATVGMGNIAGVAIALVVGGPGAIFWMWVSALVGMATKYHEGFLAVTYRGRNTDGEPQGGTMHIIEQSTGRRRHPLAVMFAVVGIFGTLCIINANQLTEALLSAVGGETAVSDSGLRLATGLVIAAVVGAVVAGGLRRIAHVATLLVPFMVALYFAMVSWIILTHIDGVPRAFATIFTGAFSLEAGWGALIGVAVTGARRAALVNEAGVGTASIMHGASSNTSPIREGLVAMLGPAVDSGFVCTLTALAIMLGCDLSTAVPGDVKGLSLAMDAFGRSIPGGDYLLMFVVVCFALSSMFSYSYYGNRCAAWLLGEKHARWQTWFFIATLVLFAVIPLSAAVSLCDLFFALMVIPTMITLVRLSGVVRRRTRLYFNQLQPQTDVNT